jgi:ankyrin repeat protein
MKSIANLFSNYEVTENSDETKNVIYWAALYGKLDYVKSLLDDPSTDPTEMDNSAIDFACMKGHFDIAKLLLNDSRVDLNSDSIKNLAEKYEFVKRFIKLKNL